jgi:hypothetical protein
MFIGEDHLLVKIESTKLEKEILLWFLQL